MYLFRDCVNNKSPSFHGETPRSNEPVSFCLHAKYPSPSRNTRLEFHRVISATRLPNFLSCAGEPRHYSPRPKKTSPRGQSEVLRALSLFLFSFFHGAGWFNALEYGGWREGCLIKIIARGFMLWEGRGGKTISRSVFGLALVRYQFRGK